MWLLDAVSQWPRDELQKSEASPSGATRPRRRQREPHALGHHYPRKGLRGTWSVIPEFLPQPRQDTSESQGKVIWPCPKHSAGVAPKACQEQRLGLSL